MLTKGGFAFLEYLLARGFNAVHFQSFSYTIKGLGSAKAIFTRSRYITVRVTCIDRNVSTAMSEPT